MAERPKPVSGIAGCAVGDAGLAQMPDVIIGIGNWVIAEALRQQARLRAAGHDLSISVNIAARQLLKGQFAEQLDAILAGHADADPGRLEIEILETAALEDVVAVSQLIAEFQGRGVRFALDDFGTGYSSLVHLKHLGADVLKIEVWRADTAKPAQYPHDPFVVAIATDSPDRLPQSTGLPLLDINDADAVTQFLLADPARYEYRSPFDDGYAASADADAGRGARPAAELDPPAG